MNGDNKSLLETWVNYCLVPKIEDYREDVKERCHQFPWKRMVVASGLQFALNGRLVRYLNKNFKAKFPAAWKVQAVFVAGIPADWAMQVLFGPKKAVEKIVCTLAVYWVLSNAFLQNRKKSWSKAFMLIAMTRMVAELFLDIANLISPTDSRSSSRSHLAQFPHRNSSLLTWTPLNDDQNNTPNLKQAGEGDESGGEGD